MWETFPTKEKQHRGSYIDGTQFPVFFVTQDIHRRLNPHNEDTEEDLLLAWNEYGIWDS